MYFIHNKEGCNGEAKIDSTNFIRILSNVGITYKGLIITSIQANLKGGSSKEKITFVCTRCEEEVETKDLVSECSSCFVLQTLDVLNVVEKSGGVFCPTCSEKYTEDGNKLKPITECFSLVERK